MSTEEYIEAMDEAIAAYKQEQREDVEKMLIKMAKRLYDAYKEYNPNGDYLNIAIIETEEGKARLHINNAFYDRDHSKKIDISEDVKI